MIGVRGTTSDEMAPPIERKGARRFDSVTRRRRAKLSQTRLFLASCSILLGVLFIAGYGFETNPIVLYESASFRTYSIRIEDGRLAYSWGGLNVRLALAADRSKAGGSNWLTPLPNVDAVPMSTNAGGSLEPPPVLQIAALPVRMDRGDELDVRAKADSSTMNMGPEVQAASRFDFPSGKFDCVCYQLPYKKRRVRTTAVSVPLVWPSLASLALAGLLIFVRKCASAGNPCACGYDLTGNVSGVCPECGAALLSESIARGRDGGLSPPYTFGDPSRTRNP